MKPLSVILFFCLFALTFPCRLAGQYRIHATIDKANCNEMGGLGGAVHLHTSGGPYTYMWTGGSTDSFISNQAPGYYTLTVKSSSQPDTTLFFYIDQWACDMTPVPVFTPNGDGIHDVWQIDNSNLYPNMWILVYNRWGQLMFQSKGVYSPWDGKSILGLPVDDATYYYILYEDSSDTKQGIRKGSVTIIR
jgi:gliding motility-associated-like protein